MGIFFSKKHTSGESMVAAKEFVESKIKSNKVVVFSKSYCPYCRCDKPALLCLQQSQASCVV